MKKEKYRNPYFVPMILGRKGGSMKDRREPRGGAYDDQLDLLQEYLEEEEDQNDPKFKFNF